MVYIYGGPHVQLVYQDNRDLLFSFPLARVLNEHGVAVAVLDNELSNANSLRHHTVCKCNMGRFETAVFVRCVEELCKALPEINPQRIGVYGWSYGGYATLLAMSQQDEVLSGGPCLLRGASDGVVEKQSMRSIPRSLSPSPEIPRVLFSGFVLGLAGAPVGDWRLYDTAYTERYMGLLPQQRSSVGTDCVIPELHKGDAYEQSTIGRYAKGFPQQGNRVFIAHGLSDENVHFSHTCHIISAMVKAQRPYSLLVYPGERHGLRQNASSRLHYDSQFVQVVLNHL